MCSSKGGFQRESPNQLLGLQISVLLRNSGTILIIGILLRYPVIIRSDHAHPEQLLAFSGSGGREQLSLWNNSLACLETSETPHVPGILSGMGRLSVLQISSPIGHLLHLKRHPYLTWVLAVGVSPKAKYISPSSIQFLMLAYSFRSNPACFSVVSVHSISQTLTLIFAIK